MYLFCYALLCVHSSFAVILKRMRKLVGESGGSGLRLYDGSDVKL